MIKRALISVYDKTDLLPIAKKLQGDSVEIIATGKTYEYLKQNGIKAVNLPDYTETEEILGGRVKTLNTKIFAAILSDPTIHGEEVEKHNIQSIDLVIVNLYPFADKVKSGASESEIIENIDIGGVSLIRAAAKNFRRVCILSDPSDYKGFTLDCSITFRRTMAKKAFSRIALYDCKVYEWFSGDSCLPGYIGTFLPKQLDFRYGENPHQNASFYSVNPLPLKKLQGKDLTYNNLLDIESGTSIASLFQNEALCIIIKHNNPCGASLSKDCLLDAYKKALAADSLSAFGGVVVFNQIITKDVAEELIATFYEVVIATGVTQDAELVLNKKPNLRVVVYESHKERKRDVRSIFDGILIQSSNNKLFQDFEVVTSTNPDDEQINNLIFAWKICKHVKSNAIVCARDYTTVGIGAGQMSRVKSVEIALEGDKKGLPCVMASDAFFPFPDSIETAAKHGVTAIIQPGGSIRDQSVIEAADHHKIAMIFTHMRHFKH